MGQIAVQGWDQASYHRMRRAHLISLLKPTKFTPALGAGNIGGEAYAPHNHQVAPLNQHKMVLKRHS